VEENRRNVRDFVGKLKEGNSLEGLGLSWWMVLKRTYRCKGCGRKNTPIWEGHSFGWGARRRTAVYVPFSVYTMAWLGEYRAFIVQEFIRNGGFPGHVIALRGDIRWPPRSPDLTHCDFFLWGYLKTKVYEQHPVTLEVLKEAIRQEVAAIIPEMILKAMDNYRERLHQFINIQGRHLSDVLFKIH